MDYASKLISELLDKLSELEQRVIEHREDVATEFKRYSVELLQDVPEDVTAEVERAIKDSIHKYPALGPGLDHSHPVTVDDQVNSHSSSKGDRKRRSGRHSPPPVLRHTSGVPTQLVPKPQLARLHPLPTA